MPPVRLPSCTSWSWDSRSPPSPRSGSTWRPSPIRMWSSTCGTSGARTRSGPSGDITTPAPRASFSWWTAPTGTGSTRPGRSSTGSSTTGRWRTPSSWSSPTNKTSRTPWNRTRSRRSWAWPGSEIGIGTFSPRVRQQGMDSTRAWPGLPQITNLNVSPNLFTSPEAKGKKVAENDIKKKKKNAIWSN